MVMKAQLVSGWSRLHDMSHAHHQVKKHVRVGPTKLHNPIKTQSNYDHLVPFVSAPQVFQATVPKKETSASSGCFVTTDTRFNEPLFQLCLPPLFTSSLPYLIKVSNEFLPRSIIQGCAVKTVWLGLAAVELAEDVS